MSAAQDPPEKAGLSRRTTIALVVLMSVAVLVFAAGWNPPTKTVHTFTNASDYKAEKESGCTNSGKGCHGAEASYQDFNAYHPNAKCTTCHEYQGVGCIPCHAPKEHECQLCHDGTMEAAPDRVRISDPYPHGHYRETTHTAMGTEMSDKLYGLDGGSAYATCEACHSRDLQISHTDVPAVDDSPYGTTVGCGECHNDVRSRGLAEVLSNWKKRSCEACHATGTSAPMHDATVATPVEGTGTLGCGSTGLGCHDGNNLHALHADAPKNCNGSAVKGEKGCHVAGAEAGKPTATSCGGNAADSCHRSYANTGYTHKKDAKEHSPRTGTPANDV